MRRKLERTARYVARRIARYLLLAGRFATLYWSYVAAAVGGAALAWVLADAASDYTQGGWELHLEQRAWGLDLHFHHWYYGIPLLALAFTLLDTRPVGSVFVFVFGMALSAHSFHNEGGIPSIFEGGPTLAVPDFLYWPIASLLAALFTFFVVRSHEWLAIQAASEEAAASYVADREACDAAFEALAAWGRAEFDAETARRERRAVRVASFSRLERHVRGIWELHCATRPVGDGRFLLTVRVVHMAPSRRTAELVGLIERADELVSPFAAPVGSAPFHPRAV
jgi:hypothetical protein